ncbi:6063_t:CDS:2 [Entrophospora sp. SA101]|nr:6063_t:CDS:2 [Entrophospora sp. SA101]
MNDMNNEPIAISTPIATTNISEATATSSSKPTIYLKYNLRSNGKVKDNNGRKQHQTELARQKQIMA